MDSRRFTPEDLLQDFYKKIKGIEKVFKQNDIKKLYKNHQYILTELELDFLYKNYTHTMIVFLSSTDSPESAFNPDNNYRTPEEAEIDIDDTKEAIREAEALGLIHSGMSRLDMLAAVMKYKNSICHTCKKRTICLCPCKAIRYCNKECQKADWKNHKQVCTFNKKK